MFFKPRQPRATLYLLMMGLKLICKNGGESTEYYSLTVVWKSIGLLAPKSICKYNKPSIAREIFRQPLCHESETHTVGNDYVLDEIEKAH